MNNKPDENYNGSNNFDDYDMSYFVVRNNWLIDYFKGSLWGALKKLYGGYIKSAWQLLYRGYIIKTIKGGR